MTALGLSVVLAGTNVNCYGGSDGTITPAVSGGTAPFTYQWSNGASTPTVSGLPAGHYFVTVTDATGCIAAASIDITQPLPMVIDGLITHVSCNAGSSGGVNITVTGGTPNGSAPYYTFAWTKDGGGYTSNTEDISGRNAGIYTVTVTDSRSCTASASFTITEPDALTATATATTVSCNGGSDGTVALTVGGGTPSYSYTWTASGGGVVPVGQIHNQSLTGLVAGTYYVSITDSKGCNITRSATVVQPAALTLSHTKIDAGCYGGSDGSVDLTVSGGTVTYTYSWSTGATTEDISGLSAGSVTVLVTDANGCTASRVVLVAQPTQVSASATASPALCSGTATGSVTASGSGGTGGYTYSLNNGTFQVSNLFTNLAAGIYTITVKDANNCTATTQVTVTEPAALDIDGFVTNVLCFGGTDGAISINVSQGTSPYSFDWSDIGTPELFTDPEDRTGIGAGTYTVTVKDANGCTKSVTYTVTQPDQLTASVVPAHVACKGVAGGSIDLTTGGGTAPYLFAWSNGASTEDLNLLAAGTYTVTVTDAHGCTATASATVTEPALALTLVAVPKDASSCNTTSGAIDLIVTNGTPGYNYVWSGPTSIGNVQDPQNLLAGTYSVTVTDALGCTATLNDIVVGTAPALSVTVEIIPGNCLSPGGMAIANVVGGVSPYTYSWTGGSTNSYLANITPGTYSVSVTDANGCPASGSGTYGALVCDPPALVNDIFTSCNGSTVTESIAANDPSPAGLEYLPLTAPSGDQGSISWNPSYNGSFVFVPAPGYNGTVSVIYQAENTDGLTATGTLTIYVSQMTAELSSVQHVNCGATNGSATVSLNPASGFSPYTYLWSDPGATTSSTVSNLGAGTYSVTVTDQKGCTASATVTIQNICLTIDKSLYSVNGNPLATQFNAVSDLLTYNITVTNTSTTTLTGIAVSDLLPGVSVSGSPIATLAPGAGVTISATYSVTAGDVSAGTVTNTAVASYTYQNVSGTVSDTQTVQAGIADISVTKEAVTTPVVSGGELIYKIIVSNAGPAPARNVVVSDAVTAFPSPQYSLTQGGGYLPWTGSYTLPSNLAKDATYTLYIKGTLSINQCGTVTNTATVSADNDNTPGNNTSGIITTSVNDITPPSITCPPAQNANPTADCKAAVPVFTPIVSDNCTASGSITITQSPLAGTMLPAGTYTVTLTATDASANSISCTTTFTVNENIITFTIEKSDANCFGTNTGWIKVTASGGSLSYYFSKDDGVSWTSPAQSGPYTFTGLGAGDYFIRVKDTAGCEAVCP